MNFIICLYLCFNILRNKIAVFQNIIFQKIPAEPIAFLDCRAKTHLQLQTFQVGLQWKLCERPKKAPVVSEHPLPAHHNSKDCHWRVTFKSYGSTFQCFFYGGFKSDSTPPRRADVDGFHIWMDPGDSFSLSHRSDPARSARGGQSLPCSCMNLKGFVASRENGLIFRVSEGFMGRWEIGS